MQMMNCSATKEQYDRIADYYDYIEAPMEIILADCWRRRLFDMIKEKKILEAGVGTGRNLDYYHPGVELTAIDFSENMLRFAKKRAMGRGLNVTFETMDIEHLSFPAAVFPAVVATFVYCSVPNPLAGLREIHRVMRPDGTLYMLEHVRPDSLLGDAFDVIDSISKEFTGVHINRNTIKTVRKAGFKIEHEENLLLDIFKLIVAKPV
jgi:ubiquinone/menaquinone biosynthesis C-methylase UbiE